MKCYTILQVVIIFGVIHCDSVKPTMTRTELKVSRSLNPEDTQTLNVMTREGTVTQLIVKRRDPKTQSSNSNNLQSNFLSNSMQFLDADSSKYTSNRAQLQPITKTSYNNWIPVQSVYYQPKIITLETIALVRNASDDQQNIDAVRNNNLGNVIDSDRIPNLPKPVTILSEDIYFKNSRKKSRSVMHIDEDGIPVIHGVRVPDDESDKKTWRNARVINGELVPYEKDFKPPAAVPIGELVYASQTNKNKNEVRNSGPYTKEDNFRPRLKKDSIGPFTIEDNLGYSRPKYQTTERTYVKFNSESGFGPFTKLDNERNSESSAKLMEYIKEINENEAKRDYVNNRKYRSYQNEYPQQIQRRMLQYPGYNSYPNSLFYSASTKLSPVTFTEGVRTPVLQYAHPELGVQPAKPKKEEDKFLKDSYSTNSYSDSGRQQYYDNSVDYLRNDVMNYPYNTYYMKPKPEQPLWIRIAETVKDNVQTGFERVQRFTRPVFEPLMEATHKISHNLGLVGPPQAQKKVGFIGPVGSSIFLPALGLVAGGAALGLGAAAVGRFLSPEQMRALREQQEMNEARSFDPNQLTEYSDEANNILVIMEEQANNREVRKRFKRSMQDDISMQHLVFNVENSKFNDISDPEYWSDTPCAKRLFCEVMVQQNEDEIVLMEKKMDILMLRIHPEIQGMVSAHLQDVMNAIKSRSCYRFRCNRGFPLPVRLA